MLENLEASSSPDTWPVLTAAWLQPELQGALPCPTHPAAGTTPGPHATALHYPGTQSQSLRTCLEDVQGPTQWGFVLTLRVCAELPTSPVPCCGDTLAPGTLCSLSLASPCTTSEPGAATARRTGCQGHSEVTVVTALPRPFPKKAQCSLFQSKELSQPVLCLRLEQLPEQRQWGGRGQPPRVSS